MEKEVVSKLTRIGLVFAILCSLVLTIPFSFGGKVSAAGLYSATITVTDNSSTARTGVVAIVPFGTLGAIGAGLLDPSGLAIQVFEGTTPVPFMVSDNTVLIYIASLLANQQRIYTLQTMYTPPQTSLPIIVGNGGYVTVVDNASLEPSANFSTPYQGYIDFSTTDYLLTKGAVFQLSKIIGGAVQLTIPVYGNNCTNYIAGSSQFTSIPDAGNLSFTSGGGVDLPFSGSAWVSSNGTAATYGIMGKCTAAGNQREWRLELVSGNGSLELLLEDPTEAQILRAWSPALADSGSWHYYAFTYDGSKTVAGIKLYRDGILLSSVGSITGYVGMTAGTSPMSIGSGETDAIFFNGRIGRVELYSIVLTQAQITTDFLTIFNSSYVGYWKMNEGAGLQQDYSGNAHNASANTGSWILDAGLIFENVNITVAGLVSGLHTIIPMSDSVNTWLTVDAVSSALYAVVPITDTTDNWIIKPDGCINYFKIIKGGTTQLYYQPTSYISGTVMPNLGTFGSTGNGTITWGTNIQLIISATGLQSIASYVSPGGADTVPTLIPVPTTPQSESTVENPGLPWYPLVHAAAIALGWTSTNLYSVLAIFGAMALGVGVGVGTGSMLLAMVGVGMGMTIGAGMGVLGWWAIIVYTIFALIFIGITKSV